MFDFLTQKIKSRKRGLRQTKIPLKEKDKQKFAKEFMKKVINKESI